jgi:hypothetical protein
MGGMKIDPRATLRITATIKRKKMTKNGCFIQKEVFTFGLEVTLN